MAAHDCPVCSATQSSPTLRGPMGCSCQAPLSMAFSRQEYWSELPFPSLGDLPNPENEPVSPALKTNSLPSGPPGKAASKPIKVNGTTIPLFINCASKSLDIILDFSFSNISHLLYHQTPLILTSEYTLQLASSHHLYHQHFSSLQPPASIY